MIDISPETYLWLKALHIISVISWMAGLLYLPRLFVYHADSRAGSVQADTFQTMERRLLRAIMNPAMVATWVFGILLALSQPSLIHGWLHAKLALVVILTGLHMLYARWRRDLVSGHKQRSPRFYRVANEIPAVLMVGIVILVVVKPF